jgi:hypothetical protein
MAHLSQGRLPVLLQRLGTGAGAPHPWRLADLVPVLLAESGPDRLERAAVTALFCLCGAVLWVFGIVCIIALCKAAKRGDREPR